MKNTIFTKSIAVLLVFFAMSFAAAAQTANDTDANFLKALEMLKKENFAEAEKAARRAISANPQSGEAYGILAVTLGFLGREAEGKAALTKALELLPKDSEWRKRIEEATAGDDDDEMPANDNTNVQTQNDDPDFDRGFALLSKGKYKEAIESFKKSAAADPNSVTFYNIGFCYFKLNQRAAALPFLEKSVELDPKYHSAFNYLGAAYEAVEQYAKSANAFRTASRLDPSNAEYKSNLALAERKLAAAAASRTNNGENLLSGTNSETVSREKSSGIIDNRVNDEFTSIVSAQMPTVGTYTGIHTGTQTNFGKPAVFNLTILTGGKYEQNNETGKFSFDAKTGKIEFLSGAMPKDWVGFFYQKGEKFLSDGNAAHDTIVIRDKKDVADGNLRDLFWYTCCAK